MCDSMTNDAGLSATVIFRDVRYMQEGLHHNQFHFMASRGQQIFSHHIMQGGNIFGRRNNLGHVFNEPMVEY